MERFVILVNGFQSLTIITKCSILDVAAVLDPPLSSVLKHPVMSAMFESFQKVLKTLSTTQSYTTPKNMMKVDINQKDVKALIKQL